MNKIIIGSILCIVVLLGAVTLGLGLGYLSFSNTAAGFEVDIKATYDNNKNVYDNGFKKVIEMAQVPAMQVDALKAVYDTAMKGRYGADGSKAMMQMIKEENPKLDQGTFVKIQQTIEIFRNEFQANQTTLISRKQAYDRFLNATTSGRVFNFIGHYPRIDLDKYAIMTSDRTESDFQTKRGAAIDLKGAMAPATTKP